MKLQPVLDAEMLGEWDALDQESESPFLRDTVDLFFVTGRETIAQLEVELDRGNVSRVKFLAHRLKGSCLNLGFLRAADYCRLLEALEALPGNAKETLRNVQGALQEASLQIQTEFPRLAGLTI